MLSEYFLNESLMALCSIENTSRLTGEILDSIHYVLSWYDKKTNMDDVKYSTRNKFELALYLSEKRTTEDSFDINETMEILANGKFSDLVPVIQSSISEVSDDNTEKYRKKIIRRRKLCELLTNKNDIQELMEKIDGGDFIDDDEIIDKWEDAIANSHDQMMSIKKTESLGDMKSLDLFNDDYSSVMQDLEKSIDSDDTLQTGISYFRNKLPAGGLEKRRLYLIGGSSGIGKSLLLNQLIVNAVKEGTFKENEEKSTYLYITGENLISESLVRFYCCLTGESNKTVIQKIMNNKYLNSYNNCEMTLKELEVLGIDPEQSQFSLKDDIEKALNNTGSNVIFQYVQARRTTVKDVESLIDLVANSCNLKGIFIDYLDLIISRHDFQDERIMLGEVSQAFKNFAVTYDVPVTTATQLNRQGYDAKASPSLIQMSESMKKIDPSDSVLFIQNSAPSEYEWPMGVGNNPKTCKKVRITWLKNRNGPVGETGHLVIPERIGNQDIFNFRIEDLPCSDDSVSPFDSIDSDLIIPTF